MKRKFVIISIISIISTLVVAFSVGGVFAFNFGKKKTSAPQRVVLQIIPAWELEVN